MRSIACFPAKSITCHNFKGAAFLDYEINVFQKEIIFGLDQQEFIWIFSRSTRSYKGTFLPLMWLGMVWIIEFLWWPQHADAEVVAAGNFRSLSLRKARSTVELMVQTHYLPEVSSQFNTIFVIRLYSGKLSFYEHISLFQLARRKRWTSVN